MSIQSTIIHNSQKNEKSPYPSTDEWKKYVFHTVEYYSAIKRNEALIHAIT